MSLCSFDKVYAFDVDDTLEVSGGPVKISSIVEIKSERTLILLAGNWAVVTSQVHNWQYLFSGMNVGIAKEVFLAEIKKYIQSNEYIMVGNVKNGTHKSDDKGAAGTAGWRFISEQQFAAGER